MPTSSPGSYKGVAIRAGSDEDIQTQLKAIDTYDASKLAGAKPLAIPKPAENTAATRLAEAPAIAPGPTQAPDPRGDALATMRSLIDKQGEKGARAAEVSEEYDVVGKKNELDLLATQDLALQNEYNQGYRRIVENRDGMYGGGQGVADRNLRSRIGAERADLAIQRAFALNDYTAAQSYADQKIEAEFGGLQSQIDNLNTFLQRNQDDLTDSETIALEEQIAQRTREYETSVARAKEISDLQIELAKNGADLQTVNAVGEAGREGGIQAAIGKASELGAFQSSLSPQEELQAVSTIAGMVRQDPDIKDFIQVRDGYQRVSAGAELDSGAGDIAIVFGYMKTLDPTSTVREGEFATAESTAGIPTQVINAYNKAVRGERLSEDQRGSFVTGAKALYDAKRVNYDRAYRFYSTTAINAGIDPTQALRDFTAEAEVTSIEDAESLSPGVEFELEGQKYRSNGDGTFEELSVSIPKTARLAYVNNNPGNLRYAGQPGATKGDGGFAKFSSPSEGFAALERQVSLDASRGHTVSSFIAKYAPPTENDTALYVQQATEFLGATGDTPLSRLSLAEVARFVARKESGTTIA